jgi:hypothetical protein
MVAAYLDQIDNLLVLYCVDGTLGGKVFLSFRLGFFNYLSLCAVLSISFTWNDDDDGE